MQRVWLIGGTHSLFILYSNMGTRAVRGRGAHKWRYRGLKSHVRWCGGHFQTKNRCGQWSPALQRSEEKAADKRCVFHLVSFSLLISANSVKLQVSFVYHRQRGTAGLVHSVFSGWTDGRRKKHTFQRICSFVIRNVLSKSTFSKIHKLYVMMAREQE